MVNVLKKSSRGQAGFSLVELMVVVAIIGILAALAVPRFQMFQAKARQSEVKNNLSHIYTLQESYFGDNDEYGTIPLTDGQANCPGDSQIGFRVTPCVQAGKPLKVRYAYETTSAGATSFTARGRANANVIVPGCAFRDTWTINNNKELEDGANHATNAVVQCK